MDDNSKIDTGTEANVTLRGVGLALAGVRPELKIVGGPMFRPAVRELIAGVGAAHGRILPRLARRAAAGGRSSAGGLIP